jgi:hypothetical protein
MAKPNDLIHAMLERSGKKLRQAVILPGGISSYFAGKKRIKYEDGGPDITNPLSVGGNPNVGPAKYYERVPIHRTSELTTTKYDMTRVVGSFVVSEQEIDENSGASKIVDIAKAKLEALEISFKNYMRRIAASTNSGDHANGVPNLLPTVNTSGTVGGLSLSTVPLFRHEVYSFGGALNKTNIEDTLDDVLLDLNNGTDRVTVIFAGRKMFAMHRSAARDKAQINISESGFHKKMINLGIVGTDHQGIPLVYDEFLDPDVMYLVNEDHMIMHILKNANMKQKKLNAPADQDIVAERFIHEYQLCSWKQHRTHALISNKA